MIDEPTRALGNAYIPHPMAEAAKTNIKILFDTRPGADHAWTGLLLGPTGSGKSAVVRRFRKEQADRDMAAGFQGRSVIKVKLPDKCSTKYLFQALLQKLDDPMATRRDNYIDMLEEAVRRLRKYETRLVIYDEAQHAVPRLGVRRDAYEVANFFKGIQDETGVNILFCGLESARRLIENPQLESRGLIEAEMNAFDWWEEEEVFRSVLCDLQSMMTIPIRKLDPEDDTKFVMDDLSDEEIAWRLSFGSRGLIRVIVKFLLLLEAVAASEERQHIDREMFARVWGLMPKADRGRSKNPFTLEGKPDHRWKPAGHAEGDRVGA